jgi:hypothetical protein
MRLHLITVGAAASALLWTHPAAALSSETLASRPPEEACEAHKLIAAAHYFRCLTRAPVRGHELSDDDVAECDARFDHAFEEAEGPGACRTPGGASTLREPLKAQVQTLVDNLMAETSCSSLTITPGDVATCSVNKTVSAIDLEALVDLLSVFGVTVTDDTAFWIQAWGGDGSNGNVCCDFGGRAGQGGYAQMTTSLGALKSSYGTTELYYYLGIKGLFARDSGGDGGTATLLTVNDLTESDVDVADTLLIAGGGGGGGAGRGTRVCGQFNSQVIEGAEGGAGAAAFAGSASSPVITAGQNGLLIHSLDRSGKGGTASGGGAGNGGSSEPGDGPTAPLGGRGGNHLSPQVGFVNAPGTQVTGGGGRGSDGGNLAGGGGGGGGYTGGGGGDRGVSSTSCVSGGGGGGSSLVNPIPDSPTCSAAPTSRPDNPNGIEGFVQITFDLGACE